MNRIIKGLGIALGYVLIASSCSETSFGGRFLGGQPESSGAITEEVFSSKMNTGKVLTKIYTGLPYGLLTGPDYKLGVNILESITGLCYGFRDSINDGPVKLCYNEVLSANNVPKNSAYRCGSKSDWTTIRYTWLYIKNVEKVPDMTAGGKSERIAGARISIPLCYFEMLRYVSSMTQLDRYVDANEIMDFPHITSAETVEKIVGLLNETINSDLAWEAEKTDDGRMTLAGAMALKFRILQWAANPTFNSNIKWHPEADEYTCYRNYSDQRWKDATEAGIAFFIELQKRHEYELIQPTEETHRVRRLAYRQAYYNRDGIEILISTRQGYSPNVRSSFTDQRYYNDPTLNYVGMFPWEDGTDFPANFDWESPSKQPFFTKGEMVPTRDPRLYESVAYPGDTYYNGATTPVYINHTDYKDGNRFLIIKYILQENNNREGPVRWSHIRLAGIMLGYAEVLNEVNGRPTGEVYKMVNNVRKGVDLPELSKTMNHDQFLKAILRERVLRLGFEEVHWFGPVRKDRQSDFEKKLCGLRSRGSDLGNPTEFTFEEVGLGDHYWATNWDTKWYLAPIPQEEINKQYGMTQNPGR